MFTKSNSSLMQYLRLQIRRKFATAVDEHLLRTLPNILVKKKKVNNQEERLPHKGFISLIGGGLQRTYLQALRPISKRVLLQSPRLSFRTSVLHQLYGLLLNLMQAHELRVPLFLICSRSANDPAMVRIQAHAQARLVEEHLIHLLEGTARCFDAELPTEEKKRISFSQKRPASCGIGEQASHAKWEEEVVLTK